MSAIVVKTLWMYGLAAIVAMLMAAVIKVIVVLLGKLERKPVAESTPRAALPAVAVTDVAADHIAAIGAAVYAAIGAHRILRIEDYGRGAGWVAEGRLAHHTSHSVPTHPGKH